MQKLKFNRVKKQVKVSTLKNPVEAQPLDNFVVRTNNFDKHKSVFFNKAGFTYVLSNPLEDEGDEVFFPITLRYQDTPEQARLFAGKSQKEINEIILIKKEYGLD